jgi:hypothetical protein
MARVLLFPLPTMARERPPRGHISPLSRLNAANRPESGHIAPLSRLNAANRPESGHIAPLSRLNASNRPQAPTALLGSHHDLWRAFCCSRCRRWRESARHAATTRLSAASVVARDRTKSAKEVL